MSLIPLDKELTSQLGLIQRKRKLLHDNKLVDEEKEKSEQRGSSASPSRPSGAAANQHRTLDANTLADIKSPNYPFLLCEEAPPSYIPPPVPFDVEGEVDMLKEKVLKVQKEFVAHEKAIKKAAGTYRSEPQAKGEARRSSLTDEQILDFFANNAQFAELAWSVSTLIWFYRWVLSHSISHLWNCKEALEYVLQEGGRPLPTTSEEMDAALEQFPFTQAVSILDNDRAGDIAQERRRIRSVSRTYRDRMPAIAVTAATNTYLSMEEKYMYQEFFNQSEHLVLLLNHAKLLEKSQAAAQSRSGSPALNSREPSLNAQTGAIMTEEDMLNVRMLTEDARNAVEAENQVIDSLLETIEERKRNGVTFDISPEEKERSHTAQVAVYGCVISDMRLMGDQMSVAAEFLNKYEGWLRFYNLGGHDALMERLSKLTGGTYWPVLNNYGTCSGHPKGDSHSHNGGDYGEEFINPTEAFQKPLDKSLNGSQRASSPQPSVRNSTDRSLQPKPNPKPSASKSPSSTKGSPNRGEPQEKNGRPGSATYQDPYFENANTNNNNNNNNKNDNTRKPNGTTNNSTAPATDRKNNTNQNSYTDNTVAPKRSTPIPSTTTNAAAAPAPAPSASAKSSVAPSATSAKRAPDTPPAAKKTAPTPTPAPSQSQSQSKAAPAAPASKQASKSTATSPSQSVSASQPPSKSQAQSRASAAPRQEDPTASVSAKNPPVSPLAKKAAASGPTFPINTFDSPKNPPTFDDVATANVFYQLLQLVDAQMQTRISAMGDEVKLARWWQIACLRYTVLRIATEEWTASRLEIRVEGLGAALQDKIKDSPVYSGLKMQVSGLMAVLALLADLCQTKPKSNFPMMPVEVMVHILYPYDEYKQEVEYTLTPVELERWGVLLDALWLQADPSQVANGGLLSVHEEPSISFLRILGIEVVKRSSGKAVLTLNYATSDLQDQKTRLYRTVVDCERVTLRRYQLARYLLVALYELEMKGFLPCYACRIDEVPTYSWLKALFLADDRQSMVGILPAPAMQLKRIHGHVGDQKEVNPKAAKQGIFARYTKPPHFSSIGLLLSETLGYVSSAMDPSLADVFMSAESLREQSQWEVANNVQPQSFASAALRPVPVALNRDKPLVNRNAISVRRFTGPLLRQIDDIIRQLPPEAANSRSNSMIAGSQRRSSSFV